MFRIHYGGAEFVAHEQGEFNVDAVDAALGVMERGTWRASRQESGRGRRARA